MLDDKPPGGATPGVFMLNFGNWSILKSPSEIDKSSKAKYNFTYYKKLKGGICFYEEKQLV